MIKQSVRRYMQRLALLVRKKQERASNHYRPHTCPYRDVDRFLVLYRQLARNRRNTLRVLGEAHIIRSKS